MGEIKNKFMRMSQSNPLWLDGRSFALVRVNYNQITACERATRLGMRERIIFSAARPFCCRVPLFN
jgi:hypothetical protein